MKPESSFFLNITSDKYSSILVPLLLYLFVFAAYYPVWNGEFLWDDSFLITRNFMIRAPVISGEVFHHFLFENSRNEFYRPVQSLSYIFDYWRAGLNATAYHQTNLALHALNSVLAFFLANNWLIRLGNFPIRRSWLSSFFLALAWALHPVHSAIAAYVSGRADSLALAGLLAGFICWEKGVELSKIRSTCFLVAAFIFAILSGCSKEIALMGWLFFLVYLWLFRNDVSQPVRVGTVVGVMIAAGIYSTLRHLPPANLSHDTVAIVPALEKVHLFFRAMGDYARLFIFPKQLFMERQVSLDTGLFTNPVRNDPFFPYLGLCGVFFLMLLGSSLFWRGIGRKLRCFGVLWFVIMILPVSNLITLNASVAEHWLYIPMLGLLFWTLGVWSDLHPRLKLGLAWISPLLILTLGARTYLRASDWNNPITFYQATIRDGGDSIRMRANLAGEYVKLGRIEEAKKIYRSILHARENYHVAQEWLDRLEMKITVLQDSDKASSVEKMRAAYELHPNDWMVAQALSDFYLKENQPRVSLVIVKGYAERNWWHSQALQTLGYLYVETHQPAQAVAAFLAAARVDVHDTQSLQEASSILKGGVVRTVDSSESR